MGTLDSYCDYNQAWIVINESESQDIESVYHRAKQCNAHLGMIITVNSQFQEEAEIQISLS